MGWTRWCSSRCGRYWRKVLRKNWRIKIMVTMFMKHMASVARLHRP